MCYHPFISFDTVFAEAKSKIEELSDKKQRELKEALNHGENDKFSDELLDMYLYCYGEIHRNKLIKAFDKLPRKLFHEDAISIIDYACGQGLAELIFADYLVSHRIERSYVKDVTLIEKSKMSLDRAEQVVNRSLSPVLVDAINSKLEDVPYLDLMPQTNTVVHMFSNVIDLPEVNFENVINFINNDSEHNNIIVCVSPYYQEQSRGNRIPEFGKSLSRYSLVYKLEKHIEDWSEDYSCQIFIFKSMYY